MAFIGSRRKEISLANLAEFPPFLRFEEVRLEYDSGSQSLITKCRLFEYGLNSIKPALKDSNKICFDFKINQADPSDFSDHSSLDIYLRDRLLPICGPFRRYSFNITSGFDGNSATEVISSILQIPQVRICSNVYIKLRGYGAYSAIARLPVEDISNWLVPKTNDGVEIYGKNGENRFLRIFSCIIPNTQKMWDHLMGVNFNFGIRIKFVLKKFGF